MTELYADIIPGISHKELDKTFQYKVPDGLKDLAVPGAFVKVPFGKGNKTINGFLIQLSHEPKIEKEKIKEIIEICSDKDLPESRMIDLAHWMKDEYDTTMIRALKTVLPVQETVKSRSPKVQTTVGIFDDGKDICLNDEQKTFCDDVKADIDRGKTDTYLLHGVTGSGKTLCYMEIISHVVSKGMSAIMLIPEISLTWQTVGRFKERFGDRVSIINSRMSKGEKYDEFKKCARTRQSLLIAEPGSAIVGSVIDLHTSVLDVKDTNCSHIVTTDGGRVYIDPQWFRTRYMYSVRSKSEKKYSGKQIICGYTCMDHDRIMEIENELHLQMGDEIIYHRVGAYTVTFGGLFIKFLPEVYVSNNGETELIRSSMTVDEYYKIQSAGGR